ncbi:MAG TPA: hypothetical protein VKZ84_03505 [Bacteriovoracaceae bacterium]|nr:hypothetical protein [Bacteriovoracaceae bacterium]
MKVLALLFVFGLATSCTPKEAPVANEPEAVETITTTEEVNVDETQAPAETDEAHDHH